MPKKPINLALVREAQQELAELLEHHPELQEPDPDREQALADYLTTLAEEEQDNDE